MNQEIKLTISVSPSSLNHPVRLLAGLGPQVPRELQPGRGRAGGSLPLPLAGEAEGLLAGTHARPAPLHRPGRLARGPRRVARIRHRGGDQPRQHGSVLAVLLGELEKITLNRLDLNEIKKQDF